MASSIQICNKALQRIGAARITSLEDNTASSKACLAIFDTTVEEVLSMADWSCARRSAELAQTNNTPTYGYDYEYQLPTDPKCLRVISTDMTPNGAEDYVIQGDKLLCNETSVSITYTALLTAAGDFGPFFSKALAAKLAVELCYAFTATQAKVDAMQQQADKDFMEAIAADSIQGSPISMRNDEYDGSRL